MEINLTQKATSPATLYIEDFYDRALIHLFSRALGNGDVGSPAFEFAWPRAQRQARELTERRFGVKLVLPRGGG